jgi:hypothetical protein
MTKVMNGKEVDKTVLLVVPNEDDDDVDDEDGENAKPLLSSNHRHSWQGRGKGTLLSPPVKQHQQSSPLGMAMRSPLAETRKTFTTTTPTTTTTTPPATSTNNLLPKHSPSRRSPSPATLSRRRLQQRAAVFKMGDSSPKPSTSSIVTNVLSSDYNNKNSSSSCSENNAADLVVLSERNRIGSNEDIDVGTKDKKSTYEMTITNNKANNMGGAAVPKTSTSPFLRYSPQQKITVTKKKSNDTPEEREDVETMRECNDETREEEDVVVPLKPFDTSVDFATKRQAWANKFEKNKNKVLSAQRLHSSTSRSPTKRNMDSSSSGGEGVGVVPTSSSSTESSATTISPVSKALMNSPSKYQYRNDRTNTTTTNMPMKEIPTELAQPLAQLYAKFDKKRQSNNNKGSVVLVEEEKKDDATTNLSVSVFKQEEVKKWSTPTDLSTPTQANISQLVTKSSSSTEVISMTTSPKDMSVSSSLPEEEKKLEKVDIIFQVAANCTTTTEDDAVFETQWTSTIDFTTNPTTNDHPFPDPDMDELFFASNEFDSDESFSNVIMSTIKPKGFNDKEENNDEEEDMDTFHSTFGDEVFVQVDKEHDEEEDMDTFNPAFGNEVFDQAEDSTKVTTDGQEEDTHTSTSGTSGWVAVKQGNFYEWSKQEAERIDNERAASEIGVMQGNAGEDIVMMIESFKAGLSPEQQYLFTNIIARYETLLASKQSETELLISELSLQQKQIHMLLGIQKQIQLLIANEQAPTPEPDDEKIECLNEEISNLRLQLAACEAALNQDSRQSNINTVSPKKNFMMSFLRKGSNKKKSIRSQSKYYDDEVENESDI